MDKKGNLIGKDLRPQKRSFPVGSMQKSTDGVHKGKVLGKRCWQCKQTSVIRYHDKKFGWSEECLNSCGPEELGKLFRF